ncbi:hypothetical protein SCA6_011111, partial [Theobroma cacao]
LMESKENNLSDAKYVHELSKDDILGLEFDDLEDVYEFYKEYASAMGFGVRKGSCRRNKDGIEVMKHFACSKEGHKVEKWEKAREPAERHAEVNDGDVQVTLLYFGVKKEIDNGFYMKHTTYDDNKLKNIFWADSTSRSDYACFGDVLAFDTIYKKNTFNLPLLVFIGVNHHHMTTIFALALLTNEDAESYIWALTTFLESSLAKERKTLLEFVRAIEDEIKNIRNNEIGEDYISIHTEPVSSQIFKVIEKYTASVYTGRTFKKFIDEMRLQQLFYHECRIDNEPSIRVYHLMKLCHVASQFVETFNKARSEIASLTRRYDEICKVNTDGISNLTEHVYDPTRVKVKGKVGAKTKWKKKPRKCGNCKKEGHTRNKCPQLELTLYSLESSSCLLDDNDVDVYERNKEVWPSQLETLFGGDSLEVFTRSYFCVAGALVGLLKPGRMSMFGTLL